VVGVNATRRKTEMSGPGTKTFGVKLSDVMARPEEQHIPRAMQEVFAWLMKHALGVEGLFRVSAGVKDMDEIKARYDRGQTVDIEGKDAHLIAGVLKAYVIELPEPLFTFSLYDQFIGAVDSGPDILGKLRQLVQKLPEANRVLAECLFLFLHKVAERYETNKMNTMNLAIVFGQILLRPKVETLELLRHAPKITHVLKCMIDNYYDVFPKTAADEKAIGEGDLILREKLIGVPRKSSNLLDVDPSNLTAEQMKLRNIKTTVEEAINMVLERLDAMSSDLSSTTSLEDTIEIAKRVRTAKRVLFSSGQAVEATG